MTTSGQGPSALQIEEGQNGGFALSGELDLASAPQLATTLDTQIAAGKQDIVLDLSGLQFCDSSGLSAFVDAHRTLQAQSRRLILQNPSSRVQKLLTATKLDQELDIE